MKKLVYLLLVLVLSSCTRSELDDGANDILSFLLTLLLCAVAFVLIIVGFAVRQSVNNQKKSNSRIIIKCDSCRKIIDGKYIAIKPPGTNLKFDYCSRACRDHSHPENMAKIGKEWSPPTDLNDFPLDGLSIKKNSNEEKKPPSDLDSFPLS